jgi:predicted DNA binding CopG/RHH family protein
VSERSETKKVRIPKKPSAEQWVAQGREQPAPAGQKIKRLTLDIPEDLHRAIKHRAVDEGVTIADMLRKLLEDRYGTS